jgi:arylsulfatase
MVRWPGLVPPHTEINEIFSAEDWAATLVAAAGEPNIKEKLLQGYDAAGKTFRVHLDGYDQRDLLAGKGPDKRPEFFYWTDDGNLAGLRYDIKTLGTLLHEHRFPLIEWAEPLQQLRLPRVFNLRGAIAGWARKRGLGARPARWPQPVPVRLGAGDDRNCLPQRRPSA